MMTPSSCPNHGWKHSKRRRKYKFSIFPTSGGKRSTKVRGWFCASKHQKTDLLGFEEVYSVAGEAKNKLRSSHREPVNVVNVVNWTEFCANFLLRYKQTRKQIPRLYEPYTTSSKNVCGSTFVIIWAAEEGKVGPNLQTTRSSSRTTIKTKSLSDSVDKVLQGGRVLLQERVLRKEFHRSTHVIYYNKSSQSRGSYKFAPLQRIKTNKPWHPT